MAQMNMLALRSQRTLVSERERRRIEYIPHPFTDGQVLEGDVMRVFKDEEGEVEYSS